MDIKGRFLAAALAFAVAACGGGIDGDEVIGTSEAGMEMALQDDALPLPDGKEPASRPTRTPGATTTSATRRRASL
jgi:hypothetical protein